MQSIKHRFFDRKILLQQIVQGVLAPVPGDFAIIAPKFSGRSRIMEHLASDQGPLLNVEDQQGRPLRFRDGNRVIVCLLDCNWPAAQTNLLQYITDHLIAHLQKEENSIPIDWKSVESQTAYGRKLWNLANQIENMEYRLVLLLNNFDSVLSEGRLSQQELDDFRPLTRKLALVIGIRQPLIDLDKTLAASPLFNVMIQVFMGLLEPDAAEEWIASYCKVFPALDVNKERLLELTGQHPFLLTKVGDILAEIQRMKPESQQIGQEDFNFIELRLGEHGLLLFESLRQILASPPSRVSITAVRHLLERLTSESSLTTDLSLEQSAALNWLINQAVVRYTSFGYRFFSPLFEQYLKTHFSFLPYKINEQDNFLDTTVISSDQIRSSQPTPQEASLLNYFQSHPNEVIASEELLINVWQLPANTSERRVQEAIRRLRIYLASQEPTIGSVKNVRGEGYVYVPVVKTDE